MRPELLSKFVPELRTCPSAMTNRESLLIKLHNKLGFRPAKIDPSSRLYFALLVISGVYIWEGLIILGLQMFVHFADLDYGFFDTLYFGIGVGSGSLLCSVICVLLSGRELSWLVWTFLVIDFFAYGLALIWSGRFLDICFASHSIATVISFGTLAGFLYFFQAISFWNIIVTLTFLSISTVFLSMALSEWYFLIPTVFYIIAHIVIGGLELRKMASSDSQTRKESFKHWTFAYHFRQLMRVLHRDEGDQMVIGSADFSPEPSPRRQDRVIIRNIPPEAD